MGLRFLTAGESHGQALISIIEGLPSNLEVDIDFINSELRRRQGGYGRGGRMAIEQDKANILSGVRFGKTTGAPIAIEIKNKDWENWQNKMAPFGQKPEDFKDFTRPRPGHADLAGGIKYNQKDLRNVLERASARETASRVAIGAFCKLLLKALNIEIYSYVTSVGKISAAPPSEDPAINAQEAEKSVIRFVDPSKDQEVIEYIDKAKEQGESLGGIFEVVAINVPPGLGSYIQWDKRIDGDIAKAMMSIQAIKGVEIGLGFKGATLFGSEVMDEIGYQDGYTRYSNHLGGTEGGMTNGMPIVVRAAMKPIPTLMNPLRSVDIISKEPIKASKERSDVTAIAAASVVGEAMLSFVIAYHILEKFGADSMEELIINYNKYLEYVRSF